jgi:hypothetical protein
MIKYINLDTKIYIIMEDVKVPSLEGLQLSEPVAPPTQEQKDNELIKDLDEKVNANRPKLEHPSQITPEQAEKELSDVGLEAHRMDRKTLCERLEKDVEFRNKYIEQQKIRAEIAKMQAWRKHREEQNEEEQEETPVKNQIADSEPLPEPEPSTPKTGVYIANVQKLVINIHL